VRETARRKMRRHVPPHGGARSPAVQKNDIPDAVFLYRVPSQAFGVRCSLFRVHGPVFTTVAVIESTWSIETETRNRALDFVQCRCEPFDVLE